MKEGGKDGGELQTPDDLLLDGTRSEGWSGRLDAPLLCKAKFRVVQDKSILGVWNRTEEGTWEV